MTHPAANKDDLRRRVDRFFKRETTRDVELKNLLSELTEICDAYIFGGLIRDIALVGIKSDMSDIDIVFEGDKTPVDKLLRKYRPSVNRFGGYRFTTTHWQIDLWEAKSTWAFKSGFRAYRDISSILNTTITNWDSIFFDLARRTVVSPPNYFRSIQDGFLDMVFTENPNELGMYVRLLRTLAKYQVSEISSSVVTCLDNCFRCYSFDDVSKYEFGHHGANLVEESFYSALEELIAEIQHDLLPVPVEQPTKHLQLFAHS